MTLKILNYTKVEGHPKYITLQKNSSQAFLSNSFFSLKVTSVQIGWVQVIHR